MQAYKLPIFITVFDRLEVLKKSIQSYYDNISTPFEIIIHDNGTTYQPTLEFIENSGFKYYKSENDGNAVSKSITDWYKTNYSPYYVVTDPDIALCSTNKDILDVFSNIINETSATVVGCSLNILNIPDYYSLKEKVIERHTQQFGHQKVKMIKGYDCIDAFIDTTFAMYKKDFIFKKHNMGLRVLKPYEAEHLDWYINPKKLTADQVHYLKTSNHRGHWSCNFLRDFIT